MHGVIPVQVQNFIFSFELLDYPANLFLQPVEVPPTGSAAICTVAEQKFGDLWALEPL